ncbi:hypothetical protein BGX31_001442 [Mortierella sp. GBA43]|nr:hypothetical protein BGX31_001442 [Mortierella sp. GBA43]
MGASIPNLWHWNPGAGIENGKWANNNTLDPRANTSIVYIRRLEKIAGAADDILSILRLSVMANDGCQNSRDTLAIQNWDKGMPWLVLKDKSFLDMSQAIREIHQYLQVQAQQKSGQNLELEMERVLSKAAHSKMQLDWIQDKYERSRVPLVGSMATDGPDLAALF